MLDATLGSLFGSIAVIGLLAATAMGLVGASLLLWPVRARALRKGLETYVRQLRRRDYVNKGILAEGLKLTRYVRSEVASFLETCAPSWPYRSRFDALPVWLTDCPPPYGDREALKQAFETVWPDLKHLHDDMIAALESLGPRLDQQVARINKTLTFLWSLSLAIVLQIDAVTLLSAGPFSDMAGRIGFWPQGLGFFFEDGSLRWEHWVGVLVTAILATLLSQVFQRWMVRVSRVAGRQEAQIASALPEPDKETAPGPATPIGRSNQAVRALAFAGGGFDTVMQLGVAHALVVIQGRAPDAVVGISAGAWNAAALAEVLQAGEKEEEAFCAKRLAKEQGCESRPGQGGKESPKSGLEIAKEQWSRLKESDKKELQRIRLLARIGRLRDFIEAAQRAPEEIFDALLPDVFQIDSHDPLRPLEQPRFAANERRARTDAAKTRSGMMSLYNDLLDIHFSLGSITRLIRRILGLKAAREVAAFCPANSAGSSSPDAKSGAKKDREDGRFNHFLRWYVISFAEAARLWILIGQNLFRASSLVANLSWRLLRGTRGEPRTAGELVFRFREWEERVKSAKNAVAFLFLLSLWSFSVPFVLTLGLVAAIAYFFTSSQFALAERIDVAPSGRGFAIRTLIRLRMGIWMMFYLSAKWMVVLAAIVAPSAYLYLYGFGLPKESLAEWTTTLATYVAVIMACLGSFATVLVLLASATLYHSEKTWVAHLLDAYQLGSSLFPSHGLKSYLVQRFQSESDYYGEHIMDRLLANSLKGHLRGSRETPRRKKVGHYSELERREPIDVGLAVAKVSDAKLTLVGRESNLIDGLLAAASLVPIFPPTKLGDELCIDGSNVSNEPSWPLLGRLQANINENSTEVQIYSVSPFPINAGELGEEEDRPEGYLKLIDVAFRAKRLQRFRDATLQRRLIEIVTKALPEGKAKESGYIRAWITPIELEDDRSLNTEILGAEKDKRRQKIAKAIADGCRASMQVIIPDAIEKAAKGGDAVPCRDAVRTYFEDKVSVEDPDNKFAGQHNLGPGLREVCQYCSLQREAGCVKAKNGSKEGRVTHTARDGSRSVRARGGDGGSQESEREELAQSLRILKIASDWPHERDYEQKPSSTPAHKNEVRSCRTAQETPEEETKKSALAALKGRWPVAAKRNGSECDSDESEAIFKPPVVSFLFSGGVFRGVFQVGVLNALREIDVKPHLIAGASVGSITAGMAIDVFRSYDDQEIAEEYAAIQKEGNETRCSFDELSTEKKGEVRQHIEQRMRRGRLARLAASYLAVDRLILTDRFADSVRKLTLRAAGTRFSIRQLDHFFRKYDHPGFLQFSRTARDVLAGIERLLYISPYQLNSLVRDARSGNFRGVLDESKEVIQRWLDKMQISDEILGAEALEMLIEFYVTKGLAPENPIGATFDDVLRRDMLFLATATNLTAGKLEVIGEMPAESSLNSAILKQGLLTSSAFPAVFRPRWSWELYPGGRNREQYIDGGVTDNLPLDAVAELLQRAADVNIIERQPDGAPHLIVAGSLQVDAHTLTGARLRELEANWPALFARSKQLGYNTKLDLYVQTETALQEIGREHKADTDTLKPLAIEVVAIKPQWLCGTFAFHPMLGYSRKKQARSIAHGCAATLLRFAKFTMGDEGGTGNGQDPGEAGDGNERGRQYLAAWRNEARQGRKDGKLPAVSDWADAFEMYERRNGVREDGSGTCWLRPGCQCPFSGAALDDARPRLPAAAKAELEVIFRECPKKRTHLRPL